MHWSYLISSRLNTLSISVRILPAQTAVDEPHFSTGDVVAKAKTARPQPVLPLAGAHAFQLFDRLSPARVVGITRQNINRLSKEIWHVRVMTGQFLEKSVELWGCADRKLRRHASVGLRMLLDLFAAVALSSRNNAETGRDFPARCSR